jgi:parvulin-like peptidyl-prolyl isomerase
MNPRSSAIFLSIILSISCDLHAESQSYGIVATVNGKPIVSSEVREAIQAQEQLIRMQVKDPREADARLAALKEGAKYALIERQLVLSEFEKLGGTIKAQYVEDDINNIIRESFGGDREKFLFELAKNNMTIKKFRDQREKMMVVSVLRARQVKDLPPPTPAQVESFYRKNSEKFRDKDYIKFSTITVPKYPVGDVNASPESQKKLAEEIRTKIANGADFAQMAKTYSQDSRADQGGDWGLQERASLNKEIADVAFALKTGTVSKVVDVGVSYMIIFCEAKQPGNQEPLEKVRPMIEKAISAEMGRDAVNRWLSGLAAKAVIQPESVRVNFLKWLEKQEAAGQQQ